MARIFLAILMALAASGVNAQTGSQKTVTQMTTEINSLWATNGAGQITAFTGRQTLLDMITSTGTLSTANTWTASQTFSAGITTGASLTLTAGNALNNLTAAGGLGWYNSTDTSVTGIIPGLATFIASQSKPAGGNALIGASVQDVLGASGVSFPSGVTGYGKLAASGLGNLIFGLFGRVEISAAGSGANEFDCNNTSADSPATFPPVISVPLATTYCIGVQSASTGTKKSHSAFRALIGVGGTAWLAGLYMDPTCCSTYGYLIDATSTQSPQFTSYLRNSGAVGNVVQTLQTMGTYTASRTVWQILDASGNQVVKATEDGGIVTISSPLAASTDALLWNLSNNNTGSTSAAFTATTNAGVMRLEADTTAGGSGGVIRWTGAGSFFIDAQNASSTMMFRTGATPTSAMNISAAQVINLPVVSTGTPAASLCIDASNNIIKKTTTGSCI